MKVTFVYCFLLSTISLFQNSQANPPILSKPRHAIRRSPLNAIDPKIARTLLDNDFESGSMYPWYDESPGYVNWRVENFTSPSEKNSTSPQPSIGVRYARVTRNANLASGLSVLRSPIFTANPGDRISFDFWIRSKRPEGNNLELVWVVDRTEQQLVSLSQYSTLANYEWRKESLIIPVDVPTEGELVFYGYCGSNLEDAIAIDNVVVESSTYTTPAPGTNCIILAALYGTFISPNYPSNYPNNANLCWLITGADSINLQFNNFATEPGRDTLKIYLGPTTTSDLYADLSGTLTPTDIYQYVESMLIVFTSDAVNTYTGFSITYQITRPTTTVPPTTTSTKPTPTYPEINCETTDPWVTDTTLVTKTSQAPSSCGGLISGYSGTFQSPNYPYEYGNNLDCRYKIQVPCGYRVRLTFTDFSTESGYDIVNVHDGLSTSDYLLLSASGSTKPSTVISSLNEILVRFTTDGSGSSSGWKATFEYY